jgi:hypothetical protein
MTWFDASFAVIAVLAAVFGVYLYAVLALGWRVLHDEARVRLDRVLRREGAAPGSAGYPLAMRRCVACSNKAECDAWLSSGEAAGVDKFCPNAAFIERCKPGSESSNA